MGNVNKTARLFIRVTDEEKAQIQERMKEAGIRSISAYTRRMLLNGQITKKDYPGLKELSAQIGKIGGNVNQVAKRANERRVVPQEDIDEVMFYLEQILRLLDKQVRQVLRS